MLPAEQDSCNGLESIINISLFLLHGAKGAGTLRRNHSSKHPSKTGLLFISTTQIMAMTYAEAKANAVLTEYMN